MRFESFVTRRYLKSKPRRKFLSVITLIAMGGVALGVTTLIVVLGVMSGFDNFFLDRITGTEAHLLVSNGLEQVIGDYREVVSRLEKKEKVLAASPVITNLVMIERDGVTAAVLLKGIDFAYEKKVTDLEEYFYEGTLDLGKDGLLIGKNLARNLGVRIGDKVKIFPPSYKPKSVTYEIKGFFSSGYYEYDSTLIYLSLGAAQTLFGLEDVATGVQVKLTNPSKAPQVAHAIYATEPGLDVKTWVQFQPNLFAALKLEKTIQFIIIVLIVVVAAFNIVSILDMTVSEKTKDIGVLKAIGANNKHIMNIFIMQGLFIGLAGTIAGSGLGLFICYLLKNYDFIKLPEDVYYLSTIPVELEIMDFVYIVSAAILLTFLASFYPARQASRLDPVEALRYEEFFTWFF